MKYQEAESFCVVVYLIHNWIFISHLQCVQDDCTVCIFMA